MAETFISYFLPRYSCIKEIQYSDLEMLEKIRLYIRRETSLKDFVTFSLWGQEIPGQIQSVHVEKVENKFGSTRKLLKFEYYCIDSYIRETTGDYIIEDTRLYEAYEYIEGIKTVLVNYIDNGNRTVLDCNGALVKVLGFKCHKIGCDETTFIRISDLHSIQYFNENKEKVVLGDFTIQRHSLRNKIDSINAMISVGGAFQLCSINAVTYYKNWGELMYYAKYLLPEEVQKKEHAINEDKLQREREREIRREQERRKKEKLKNCKNDTSGEFQHIEFISYDFEEKDLTRIAGHDYVTSCSSGAVIL